MKFTNSSWKGARAESLAASGKPIPLSHLEKTTAESGHKGSAEGRKPVTGDATTIAAILDRDPDKAARMTKTAPTPLTQDDGQISLPGVSLSPASAGDAGKAGWKAKMGFPRHSNRSKAK